MTRESWPADSFGGWSACEQAITRRVWCPEERSLACRGHRGSSRRPASNWFLFEPRCLAPSHQKYSTSSSTISTTNRQRSKPAALSPSPGSRERESTSLLASSSTTENPLSNCGRGPFRILPTLPLTTLAVSSFSRSHSVLMSMRMGAIGSAHFTT